MLYWSIIDLQYHVSFRCTAKWFIYIYICILFQILFPDSLLQDIGEFPGALVIRTWCFHRCGASLILGVERRSHIRLLHAWPKEKTVHRYRVESPVLHSRSLFLSFIYSSVHMLIPNSKFIPPPLSFFLSFIFSLFWLQVAYGVPRSEIRSETYLWPTAAAAATLDP